MEEELGSIEPGKRAHLVVVAGELFDEEAQILDVWIDGLRYLVEERPEVDLRGKWQLGHIPVIYSVTYALPSRRWDAYDTAYAVPAGLCEAGVPSASPPQRPQL